MSSSFRYNYRSRQEPNIDEDIFRVSEGTGINHDGAFLGRVNDFDEGFSSSFHYRSSGVSNYQGGGNRRPCGYQEYNLPLRSSYSDNQREIVHDYDEEQIKNEVRDTYQYKPNLVRDDETRRYARRPSKDDSTDWSGVHYIAPPNDNPSYSHSHGYDDNENKEEDRKMSVKSSVGVNPGAYQESFDRHYPKQGGKENPAFKTVQVSPGVFLRLRGAAETWKAIYTDAYSPCSCICCEETIFCIDDAVFVLCPLCDTISPVGGILSEVGFDGGVGLGFTLEELGKWQMEMEGNVNGTRRY